MYRRLLIDSAAVASSAAAFGLVYGLAARSVGLSLVETVGMSIVVFAGSAQFAALGLLAAGAGWPSILATTLALNARHVLYGVAMLPWLEDRPPPVRAALAFTLSDEVFALAASFFERIGRSDLPGYLICCLIYVVWPAFGAIGYLAGSLVADPATWGVNVVFPIAMAGLALGFLADAAMPDDERRSVAAAALVAAFTAVAVALLAGFALGIAAGAVIGLAIGFWSLRRSPA